MITTDFQLCTDADSSCVWTHTHHKSNNLTLQTLKPLEIHHQTEPKKGRLLCGSGVCRWGRLSEWGTNLSQSPEIWACLLGLAGGASWVWSEKIQVNPVSGGRSDPCRCTRIHLTQPRTGRRNMRQDSPAQPGTMGYGAQHGSGTVASHPAADRGKVLHSDCRYKRSEMKIDKWSSSFYHSCLSYDLFFLLCIQFNVVFPTL